MIEVGKIFISCGGCVKCLWMTSIVLKTSQAQILRRSARYPCDAVSEVKEVYAERLARSIVRETERNAGSDVYASLRSVQNQFYRGSCSLQIVLNDDLHYMSVWLSNVLNSLRLFVYFVHIVRLCVYITCLMGFIKQLLLNLREIALHAYWNNTTFSQCVLLYEDIFVNRSAYLYWILKL